MVDLKQTNSNPEKAPQLEPGRLGSCSCQGFEVFDRGATWGIISRGKILSRRLNEVLKQYASDYKFDAYDEPLFTVPKGAKNEWRVLACFKGRGRG